MPKASKQNIIDEIVKEIQKGFGRGKVMGTIGKKWEISRTTFDRYWKTANEHVADIQQRASKAADAVYIAAKERAAIAAVMSRQARLEYLTKIVHGKIKTKRAFLVNGKIKEHPEEPDHTARIKAIVELNKMEGDYAPDKVANVTTDGEDVKQVQLLSDNQFSLLIKSINEAGAG